jgi:hypothetical protein
MELRPIDRTDRGVNRLHRALSIYRETILPEAQNPEKQILYWIDHSKDNLTDEFRCFALLDGRDVVGYLQYSYFGEEHLFFFEYLCIQGGQRSGMVPSDALQRIEEHLINNYRPEFTIVFEIAQKQSAEKFWKSDRKLIGYFKRLGFRTVDFDYRYPILQNYEGDFSYPADLMVRLPNQRKVITAAEMRTILRSIYFKHYLRWDRPFLNADRFVEREELINQLYSREVARISGNDSFGTDGLDRRSFLDRFTFKPAKMRTLLRKIFAPKFPRIMVVMLALMGAEWFFGNAWALVPFVLAVAALYCLAEDSDNSRKLFSVIVSKLPAAGRRVS